MAFKSSILTENNSSIKTEGISISKLTNTDTDSYLYNLLEFDDKLHEIEIRDKCDIYRALKEDIISEENGNNSMIAYNEGILGTAASKLVEIIQAIIDYIKKFVRMIFNMDNSEEQKFEANKEKVKKAVDDARKSAPSDHVHKPTSSDNSTTDRDNIERWVFHPNKTFNIKVYHYPDINRLDTQKFRSCLQNITNELERVCKGEPVAGEASEASLSMAYKTLATIIKRHHSENSGRKFEGKVYNSSTFKELIKTELCFIEEKQMTFDQWVDMFMFSKFYKSSIYGSKVKEMERDLEDAKRMVSNASITTEDQRKHANALVHQIECVIHEYSWFINYILKMSKEKLKYLNSIASKIMPFTLSYNFDESSTIHGEEFSSDTLFDNEDLRDFNSTEWLDLSLTTECFELKHQLLESHKRITLQEALIMTDDKPNKFNRLLAMREAEETSLKDSVKNIFERLKELFNKFTSTIKEKYAEYAKTIQRNKAFIEKPIKNSASSTGDILAGMYRIQQKLNIIPFNYETMKDDLKDKNTFFEKRILNSLKNTSQYSKRKLEWSSDMSITDYCKAYYGASMPENKYPKCEFSAQELEANKKNIITFLSQTNNIFSVKNDLTALENESRKISSKSSSTNVAPASTDENNEVKPQNNSYYSNMYSRYFNEIEIEKGAESNEEDSAKTNAAVDEANAFKVYTEVYKDIFLSKITAAQFIAQELYSLVLYHSQSNMSNDQKKAEQNQLSKDSSNKN